MKSTDRIVLIVFCLLFVAPTCLSQGPLTVVRSGWRPALVKGQKVETPRTGPARLITSEDTMIARTNRQARTDHPENPSDMTPDGRRDAIESNEQEAEDPQPADVSGFVYTTTVKNESTKTVTGIFWQYEFAEVAHPADVVRRQFLCSVKLKKGAQIELSAFSTLGPTDTVSAAALASKKEAQFTEKVQVNRIEFSDDEVLQRGNWKFEDVKDAFARATATPWGKENCRPLK